MNVLIIGAGRRGLRIAQHLVSEGASIVFLDRNAARCQIAEAKLDCLAVNGSGTDLEKLRDAGAGTVDTVISATDSDEVNIVSCGIIASAFPNVENTTAVIRSSGYLGDQELPHKILGITHLINPDLEGALRIVDTVRYGLYQDTIIFPGTDFILFTVPEGVGLIRSGSRLSDLRKNLPYDFVITAIYRNASVLIPSGDTEIRQGDVLAIITDKDQAYAALSGSDVKAMYSEPEDIVILGATRITRFLLNTFTPRERKKVRLIEKDEAMAEEFASLYPEIMVLNSSITDELIWENEDLGMADLFLSLTDNDELNIVTSGYAKKLGVRKAIAQIKSNNNYVQFALSLNVDVALSITDVTTDAVIRLLRGDGVSAMHSLFNGDLEVYEYIVQDDFRFIGRKLKEVKFRSRVIIAGARKADGSSFIPDGEYCFEAGDSLILAIRHEDSGYLKELFQ